MIKFCVKIDDNDFKIKIGYVWCFFNEGYKVKVIIMFCGCEWMYFEFGECILVCVVEMLVDVGVFEGNFSMMGMDMNMIMVFKVLVFFKKDKVDCFEGDVGDMDMVVLVFVFVVVFEIESVLSV